MENCHTWIIISMWQNDLHTNTSRSVWPILYGLMIKMLQYKMYPAGELAVLRQLLLPMGIGFQTKSKSKKCTCWLNGCYHSTDKGLHCTKMKKEIELYRKILSSMNLLNYPRISRSVSTKVRWSLNQQSDALPDNGMYCEILVVCNVYSSIALDKALFSTKKYLYFSYFLTKTYVAGTH